MLDKNSIEKELIGLIKKKKYSDVFNLLKTLNDNTDISNAIRILKRRETFIDFRGAQEFKAILNEIELYNPLILRYLDEVKIFNSLFEEEKKLQDNLLRIPARFRFAYLFLMSNSNYYKIIDNIKESKTKSYGETDKFIDLVRSETSYSSTLKSLFYDHQICNNNSFKYSCFLSKLKRRYCIIASDYLFDSAKIYRLHSLFHFWKYGLAKVDYENGAICFKFIKGKELTWLLKSHGKYSVYENILELECALIANDYPLTFTDDKSLKYHEVYSIALLKYGLHQQDENFKIKNIPLKYWIKAYEFVINYSKKLSRFINLYYISLASKLLNNCVAVKSRSKWIRLMVQSGVPYEYAPDLFDYMIQTSKSDDLYDFPFISIKEKYLLCFPLLSNAASGLVIQSRFNQPDIAFSQKGTAFEKYIKDLFIEKNIPVVQLHRKDNKLEYECDMAFILEDVLFMCELKDYGEKQLRFGQHDFYLDDVNQLQRIGTYFENHKDYVVETFLKNGYKVNYKKVIKLLIYNTFLHGAINVEDVKVIDFETFIAPIRRGDLDKRLCDIYSYLYDCLTGNYTAKKFLKYINTPFYPCDYDKVWTTSTNNFMLGDIQIRAEELRANPINRDEIHALISPIAELKLKIDLNNKRRK